MTAVQPIVGVTPSPPLAQAVLLRVIEGPDRGKTMVLDDSLPTRILVGRSASCDFVLRDAAVSRRHLALEARDGKLVLTDLGSTNGTQYEGVPMLSAPISGHETVKIGSSVLGFSKAATQHPIELPQTDHFGRVMGGSREMRRLYALLERLAAASIPLLIEGETGTGKELLAESLHEVGPRRNGPFVVFDCTAVAPSLVESALFGHERGAFTGAIEARPGVFEQADGGTLLIDEIGDLDLALQPKLLRALERSEFRRVGGSKTLRVDVRVLSATRRDLDNEVQAGRFRDDLFHRLAVTRIELPPLRRRRGDVRLLALAFCRALGGDREQFDEDLLARWDRHEWPGNIRELRNAVIRKIALGDLGDVGRIWSSAPAKQAAPVRVLEDQILELADKMLALDMSLHNARERFNATFERRYVERVLEKHAGNVTRAAAATGVARRHFYRLLARGAV